MAGKSNNNATLFAQKKLLNKAHTSVLKSDAQETITTNIQPAAQTTFGQAIPATPEKSLYLIQSASAGKPGTIEYVQFDVSSISGTSYDGNAVDSGAGPEPSNVGPHGYTLILTGNYTSLSNNPKKGNGVFDDGKILSGTLGQLQIIPPVFSTDRPNPYSVTLYKGDPSDATQVIALESEIDYQLDTFNGILFVQDYDAANVPLFARAFIYTGDMVDTVIENSGGGGGSGDSNAAYLTLSLTGSLANERRFNPTTGLSATDLGAGNNYTLKIDDSTVATLTGSVFTGDVLFQSGLSGSLQQLTDGTSYLREGTNVSIVSSSDGHITISSTAGSSGGGGHFTDPASGFLNTTGSTSFAGELGPSHTTTNIGSDTFFFVSGAIDSRGTSTRGAAVFGGDVVLSGTLSVNRAQAGVGSFVTITSDGKVGIGSDTPAYKLSVGGNMDVGEYIYHKNDANTFIRFQEDQIHIKAGNRSMIKMKEDASDQVLILSGGGVTSPDPDQFADTNFFVSGAIGSRGGSSNGTSVFGGDLVISGTSHHLNGISGSLTALVDGTPYLRSGAGISVTTGSFGQVTIASTGTSGLSRTKSVYFPSPTSAGSSVSVSPSDFSQAGYSQDKIDIFVNGQLLHSGSQTQVNLGERDYYIDTSTSLKFAFDILIDDILDVVVFTVVS